MKSELDFEKVYTDYYSKIYRYLMQRFESKEAEDLTQDVFMKISNVLHTFENQSQISTWIYKIAQNMAIDRMRSRSYGDSVVDKFGISEEDLKGKTICLSRKVRSIEEQVMCKEMSECVREVIGSLPMNYRDVIILSEIDGLKNSEIAELMGLSIDVVKIRLHRARVRLKAELLENCNFYQTECNSIACERKKPSTKRIKPFGSLNTRKGLS